MKKKRYYYLYKITNLKNKKIYIGVHSTYNLEDDYMGSGTRIKEDIKKYGIGNFQKEILEYFKSVKKCFLKEREIVNEEFIKREDTYNIILGGGGFGTIGNVCVRDKTGKTFMVNKEDTRYLNGELVHIATGKIPVKDNLGNFFQVNRDDPRYLSGELVSIAKGKLTIKDSEDNTFQVSKDDPRYISGELAHICKGKVIVKDAYGNRFSVDKNDHRYLSGELSPVNKGVKLKIGRFKDIIKVKDNNGNIIFINKNDPRYLSGELRGAHQLNIKVIDDYGKIFIINKNDIDYVNGKFKKYVNPLKGYKLNRKGVRVLRKKYRNL